MRVIRRARAYRIASLLCEVCREKMEGSMKTLRKAFTGDEEKETDYVRQVSQGHVPRLLAVSQRVYVFCRRSTAFPASAGSRR